MICFPVELSQSVSPTTALERREHNEYKGKRDSMILVRACAWKTPPFDKLCGRGRTKVG